MNRNEKMRLPAKTLIIFALTFVFVIGCIVALPFTSEAANKKVTVIYEVNENGKTVRIPDMEFELYKVGSVDGKKFKLNSPYDELGVDTSDLSHLGDSAKALYDKIKGDNNPGDAPQTLTTGSDGKTSFEGDVNSEYLLATDKKAKVGNHTYSAHPMYIGITANSDDSIIVKPASDEDKPPKDAGDKLACKVVKHWKNDSASMRPKSIDVEICKQDKETGQNKVWKTVKLNSGNDWTYEWSDNSTASSWSVVEKTVPSGYSFTSKKTTDKNGVIFTITNNKRNGSGSNPGSGSGSRYTRTHSPIGSVKTGDPTQLRWFLTAMILSGVVLLLLAVRESRRRTEE